MFRRRRPFCIKYINFVNEYREGEILISLDHNSTSLQQVVFVIRQKKQNVMAAMRRQNTFPLRKVRTGPGAAAAALAAVPGRLGKSRSADQPVDLQLPPAVPVGRTRGTGME